jgi:AcrR family transcriptional regulator
MIRNGPNCLRAKASNWVSHRLPSEQRRQQILEVAAAQFAACGLRATTTDSLAKAAGVSEPVVFTHFSTKEELFQEVLQRNSQDRLAALRQRFCSISNIPPLDCVERMAESTVLACVDDTGNASIMAWGLMEMPEFAADIYRSEIGSTELLWVTEIETRFAASPFRTRLAVHLVPYAVHACMAFGFWLAALHHKPATAQANAQQFVGGVVGIAREVLAFPSESLELAAPPLRC